MSEMTPAAMDAESAVKARYSGAARAREDDLCCASTVYDSKLLEAIPAEVVERDYGCGDPTAHLRSGETVLDLGSGSGKHCFMASQVVGRDGRVIGIDMNDDMLELARRSRAHVAERIGFSNVGFGKARIQDLALDLEKLDRFLDARPVRSAEGLAAVEAEMDRLRREEPLVPSDSVDVIISNCVLNLVRSADKQQLFREIFRVLKRGGRAVISDIVCDEDVPDAMQADPDLWSGCISGAFREDLFLRAFEDAGFHGVSLLQRGSHPWRTVEGIEFRTATVVAYKGKQGPCLDQKHAVIYRGPFREVTDDDGHVFRRGARVAVCEKTHRLLTREPYAGQFESVLPLLLVPLEDAPPFPCTGGMLLRHPRETKGEDYNLTTEDRPVCDPDTGCC